MMRLSKRSSLPAKEKLVKDGEAIWVMVYGRLKNPIPSFIASGEFLERYLTKMKQASKEHLVT